MRSYKIRQSNHASRLSQSLVAPNNIDDKLVKYLCQLINYFIEMSRQLFPFSETKASILYIDECSISMANSILNSIMTHTQNQSVLIKKRKVN